MTKKSAEHENFGNLLGKLVQVPKEEADAEEAQWKAMRKRLEAKGEAKGVMSWFTGNRNFDGSVLAS